MGTPLAREHYRQKTHNTMANSTVYPFGPDGQLPSGISIVNDFTTGGADKAASAETVKVLYNTMNGLEREVDVELDVTGAARHNYMINSTGKWAAASSGEQCVLLNIVGVTKITVTMDGSNGSVALLKDANNMAGGNTPHYATGESARRVINNGNSLSVVPPEDATILYVTVHTSSADIAANYEITAKKVIDTGGFIERADIVDNLNSDDATAPLSAKQGKALKGLINAHPLTGKKVAVIGDSISTIYGFDTPYWTVKDIDVGNTIQSYVTWQDVYGNYVYPDTSHPTGKTIGGVALTESMIDGELHSFTPVAADIGKTIGVPRHYDGNTASVNVWSKRLCDAVGATLLANASWSGSAITSVLNDGGSPYKVSSQAWHPCTIGRCRVRDDEGNFINPDVIIIYRGTNDFSYSNNGNYPDLDIDDVNLMSGFSATTDKINGVYSFKTGYYMIIKALREAYPDAIIVLCTLNVFKRVTYNKWPTRNDAFTLPDINNAIREVANMTGCPIIEFDKDGITFENCYPTYISDNATTPTHPNTNGHRVMAEKALADLTYALNPSA